jgi:transcriptional regulator with XRE-family HTH domain
MSAITALVKGLRATGLTQSDIARRTGIPQPRLSRWEAGGAPASADDALKLHQLHLEVGAAGLSSHIATGPQCPSGIDIPAPIRRGISDSELIDVLALRISVLKGQP